MRVVAACLAACLLLTGCKNSEDIPAGSDDQSSLAAAQRIITLAPHLTELVYSAGAGDRIVVGGGNGAILLCVIKVVKLDPEVAHSVVQRIRR